MAEWQPDLFNRPEYAALHGAAVTHRAAQAAFHAAPAGDGRFVSPGRGPYGGFDACSAVAEEAFDAFVAAAEDAVRAAGARSLDVTMPPLCHGPHLARRLVVLCRRGYRVVRQELNQSIPIAAPGFAMQAAYATRKRLAKATRAGATARLLPLAEARDAYDAVAANRLKKGRAMSLSWPALLAMGAAFPGDVAVFGAEHQGATVAGAICMVPNPRVLYVHAWGERDGAEALSPVSLLAGAIHRYGRARGMGLMDLGTSSIGGAADPGLASFKRSLGAAAAPKLWLSRSWA